MLAFQRHYVILLTTCYRPELSGYLISWRLRCFFYKIEMIIRTEVVSVIIKQDINCIKLLA